MTIDDVKAAMLCALALTAIIAAPAAAAPSAADEFVIESDSEGIIDNFHYSRSKRSKQCNNFCSFSTGIRIRMRRRSFRAKDSARAVTHLKQLLEVLDGIEV